MILVGYTQKDGTDTTHLEAENTDVANTGLSDLQIAKADDSSISYFWMAIDIDGQINKYGFIYK